jgi:hypothetical protein
MKHVLSCIGAVICAATICLSLSVSGCDRQSARLPKASTAQAASTIPTTLPVTRPSSCVMSIDGIETSFPGARLRLMSENDEYTATFFSDDPAEAIRPDYQGNSFYLTMKLVGMEEGKLDQAKWVLQNPERAEGDSPEGIFIRGQQEQLRPLNVKAEFEDHGQLVIVKLSGEFQAMSAKVPDTKPRKTVEARIEASLERK